MTESNNNRILILLIALMIYSLVYQAINAWQFTENQRTMFQYGKGHCSMDKEDLVIICK